MNGSEDVLFGGKGFFGGARSEGLSHGGSHPH